MHLGNSLILYYPSPSDHVPAAGSIQKITQNGKNFWMTVKRQAPLPPGAYDPFSRYPFFSARLYSSNMGTEDHIPLSSIITHVARFHLHDYAVILNLSRVSSKFAFYCLHSYLLNSGMIQYMIIGALGLGFDVAMCFILLKTRIVFFHTALFHPSRLMYTILNPIGSDNNYTMSNYESLNNYISILSCLQAKSLWLKAALGLI